MDIHFHNDSDYRAESARTIVDAAARGRWWLGAWWDAADGKAGGFVSGEVTAYDPEAGAVTIDPAPDADKATRAPELAPVTVALDRINTLEIP